MIFLGIETSGRAGSVAVADNDQLLGEVDLSASGRRHARTLVPEIAALLSSLQLTPQDVDVVAVSIGPGSFTGLRVGVTCAKTLAYATGCRLVAIDTFLAVAAAQQDTTRVWVIDDPLRGDLFAGEYEQQEGLWRCVSPAQLQSLDSWRSRRKPEERITGPGLVTLEKEFTGSSLGESSTRLPHARSVVFLANQQAQTGHFADPWTLSPFYMRRSAAEEKADEKGLASSSAQPSGQ